MKAGEKIFKGIEQKMQINIGREKDLFPARVLYLIIPKVEICTTITRIRNICSSNVLKEDEEEWEKKSKPFLARIRE